MVTNEELVAELKKRNPESFVYVHDPATGKDCPLVGVMQEDYGIVKLEVESE